MAMVTRFANWFLTSIWPWVAHNVWPEIRIRLQAIFAKAMDDVEAAMAEWFAARRGAREQAARRAAEAEEMASASETHEAAREYRAIAKVWRQVAEDFRQENEELRGKLDEVLARAKSTFVQYTDSLNIEGLIQRSADGSLRLVGSEVRLGPPPPDDELMNDEGQRQQLESANDRIVPIEELRGIANKLGLGEEVPDDKLCAAINYLIDEINGLAI
jgi:hypothetical protein